MKSDQIIVTFVIFKNMNLFLLNYVILPDPVIYEAIINIL